MVALLALALLAAALFARLGSWQLDRAESGGEPVDQAPVALTSVAQPQQPLDGEAVAGPVRVSGTYAPEPVLVEGRAVDGSAGDGAWVVWPLQVEAGTGTALLPVVRGWVPTAPGAAEGGPTSSLLDPPAGTVRLEGRLQASEAPRGVGEDGRLSAMSVADLVNVWDGPVYTGYLLPTGSAAPAGLTAVPVPQPDSSPHLQNLSYAFQWWVFASFAVIMWWRIVRDSHRRELEDAEDAAAEAAQEQDAALPARGRAPEPAPEPAPEATLSPQPPREEVRR